MLPFTIVRRGAVVDPVTVRAVELLPGVTMEPRVLPAGKSVDSARFSAEAGSFSSQNFIYLIASSGDLAEDTVRLTFHVQAISKPTTTFVPAGIGIAPGDSGSAKLVVTRIQGEYQGAVSFALLEPPPGLAATLTVQPDSFSAVIQVRAARDQKPGDYTIPIALYSFFPIPDTLQLLVHVFQPGNIVFAPCTEAGTVRVVAFQDGNAPWREASRFAGDLYFPNVVSERGGIAWSTEDNTGNHVQIVYGTREELSVYSTSGCYAPPVAPTSMTGTLVGGRADDVLLLHSGWQSSPLVRTSSSAFRIDNPPEYSFALFAVRRRSASEVPRMAIRRMILVSSGPVIAPLDFASANGFDAIASTLSVPNAPSSGLIVETSFHQGASDAGFVPYRTDTVATGIKQHVWFGAPLGRLETNDWHQVLVRDRVPASSSWSRSSSRGYFLPPSSSELRLPDVPIAPLFNSSRSPDGFVRVRAVVTDPASSAVWEDSNYQLRFTQPNGTRVSVTTTRRYLDGMPLAIDVPELVTPNWMNRWRLQPGVSTTWQLRTRRWARGYFDSQFSGVSTESTEVRGVITLP